MSDESQDTQSEIAALEAEMSDTNPTDRSSYWLNEGKQARYLELMKSEERRSHPDGPNAPKDEIAAIDGDVIQVSGVDAPTVQDVKGWGLDDAQAREAANTAMSIMDLVPESDRHLLDASVAGLPDSVRGAMVHELARPMPNGAEHASDAVLDKLREKGCGPLIEEWGRGATRRVGIARDRLYRAADSIPDQGEAEAFIRWFDNLSGPEMTAILRMTA